MSRVRVRLRMDGLRLDFEGEQRFFDSWVAPLLEAAYVRRGGASAVATLGEAQESSPQVSAERTAPDVSPEPAPAGYTPDSAHFSRFVRQVGERAAKPDQQVMAFAFFLWNYEQVETWGADELAGCFRAVGLPVPDDLADIIADLTKRRRFLEVVDDGTWKSTRKGVNYVKNRLLSST